MTTTNAEVRTGKIIEQRREALGWSMSEFADKATTAGLANIHPTTVGRIERGERALRLSEAVVIAHLLDLDLRWLASEDFARTDDARYASGYNDALADAQKSLDGLRVAK